MQAPSLARTIQAQQITRAVIATRFGERWTEALLSGSLVVRLLVDPFAIDEKHIIIVFCQVDFGLR